MSEVGIDALVIKARALARELNTTLAVLEREKVEIRIITADRPPLTNRVALRMTFPYEEDD